jgi:hypothetical protein
MKVFCDAFGPRKIAELGLVHVDLRVPRTSKANELHIISMSESNYPDDFSSFQA